MYENSTLYSHFLFVLTRERNTINTYFLFTGILITSTGIFNKDPTGTGILKKILVGNGIVTPPPFTTLCFGVLSFPAFAATLKTCVL